MHRNDWLSVGYSLALKARNTHSSYCLSKLEIVEWYIQLLEVGSEKYVVPHNKPYLETIRSQLLACHKKIMSVKITNPNDRSIIGIKYPPGYSG